MVLREQVLQDQGRSSQWSPASFAFQSPSSWFWGRKSHAFVIIPMPKDSEIFFKVFYLFN